MIQRIKDRIKKVLASAGVLNPALGAKMDIEGKAEMLLKYKPTEVEVFVETGTEFGKLIQRLEGNFKRVYSIELDTKLYQSAQVLFKESKKVRLFHGDSGEVINMVLAQLNERALFWLDAHGTGAMTVKNSSHCPVEKELSAIFGHGTKGHIILIDDVRHFDRYTISLIQTMAKENGYQSKVENGIFVLTPVSRNKE